jgi:hypothetical protein
MEEQRLTLAMTGFLLSESQRMSDINIGLKCVTTSDGILMHDTSSDLLIC